MTARETVYGRYQRWVRNKLLDRKIFYTAKEEHVLIESWRNYYNTIRSHSSLGYRPPAPETVVPSAWATFAAALSTAALRTAQQPVTNMLELCIESGIETGERPIRRIG